MMKLKVRAVIVVCLLFFSAHHACALDDWPMYRHDAYLSATSEQQSELDLDALRIVWDKPHDFAITSPVAADLEGDGSLEVVYGTANNKLTVLDFRGNEKWSISLDAPIGSPPAIYDLDDNGIREIIAVTSDNRITAVTSEGLELWRYQADSDVAFHPVLAGDFIEDGETLILAGDIVLYADGTRKRKHNLQTIDESFLNRRGVAAFDPTSGYVVADLDGDGRFNVQDIPRDGGEILGNLFGGESYVTPTVADVTANGSLDIVFWGQRNLEDIESGVDWGGTIKSDDFLYLLTSDLQEQWRYTVPRIGGVSVADLSGDERLELVFGSEKGVFYVLSPEGQALWHETLEGGISHPPAIADLDGDGASELIIATNAKHLYAYGIKRFPEATTSSTSTTSILTTSSTSTSTSSTSTLLITTSVYVPPTTVAPTQEEQITSVIENLLLPGLVIIVFFLLVLFYRWPKKPERPPSKLERAGFRKEDLEESVPPSDPYSFKP